MIPEAPAAPPPLDLDTDDELLVGSVLHCHPIECHSHQEQLLDWVVESRPEPSGDILLAEDGLPFLQEPLDCNHEQCFVLEVPLTRSDILQWSQAGKPEEMASMTEDVPDGKANSLPKRRKNQTKPVLTSITMCIAFSKSRYVTMISRDITSIIQCLRWCKTECAACTPCKIEIW